jgi:hypothetical protein
MESKKIIYCVMCKKDEIAYWIAKETNEPLCTKCMKENELIRKTYPNKNFLVPEIIIYNITKKSLK